LDTEEANAIPTGTEARRETAEPLKHRPHEHFPAFSLERATGLRNRAFYPSRKSPSCTLHDNESPPNHPIMTTWHVYMLRCADGSLYTGVATDVERRFAEHSAGGPKAAKYVRGRTPLKLVYRCAVGTRAEASREEYRIKRLRKAAKEALVVGRTP